jgi:hypothetical protein
MRCFLTTRKEAANLREFSLIFCGARKIRADWRGLADSTPSILARRRFLGDLRIFAVKNTLWTRFSIACWRQKVFCMIHLVSSAVLMAMRMGKSPDAWTAAGAAC